MFFRSKTPTPADKKAKNKDEKPDLKSGALAETHAEKFLHKHGLKTLSKNYRCKQGEIDLIMTQQDELVFVEVRLRSHSQFANAAESVTIAKQRKIIKAAQHYLQEHQLTEKANCRFDVIAFGNTTEPEWIKNAFTL